MVPTENSSTPAIDRSSIKTMNTKKPSRRLLARRATAANKNITKRNATESPLLRLPPEIRNRIWTYVLGGNTLHIFVDGASNGICRYGNAICVVGNDENHNYRRFYERLTKKTGYEDRHARAGCCLQPRPKIAPSTLSLALLKVCRQLHVEAALLPYMLNTFSFCLTWEFEGFIGSLLRVQQQSIHEVVISAPSFVCFSRPSTISALTNLTKFEYHRTVLERRDANILSDKMLQRLEKLPLTKVRIRSAMRENSAHVDHLELIRRTTEIEDRLLASHGEDDAATT